MMEMKPGVEVGAGTARDGRREGATVPPRDLPSVSRSHPGISLVASAVGGPLTILRALLEAGADACTPDAFGRTPLLYAARARDGEAVVLLRGTCVPTDEP